MRRIGICALLLLWLLSALPGVTWADGEIELASEAAILMDAGTGQILYAKNARERLYPASITKVMTALLTLEAVDQGVLTLDQPVTAPSLVNDMDPTGSSADIKEGEVLTVEQLLSLFSRASGSDEADDKLLLS